jgi:hypothetical protein
VNTEEQRLADMLQRVTPEPPRRVSVEDVAFRMANAAGTGHARSREPRSRTFRWNRGWAPALAAASVLVIAGASAGIAATVNSHSSRNTAATGGAPTSPASTSQSAVSQSPPSTPSANPTWPPVRVANGMWGAELINRQTFTQGSLAAGDGALFALSAGYLDRIDPATGNVLQQAQYSSPLAGQQNRPVISGNKVWVLSSYSGSSVVLEGFTARNLTRTASVALPVSGQLASQPEGVLASGPNGDLYVATGDGVAVVDPGTDQVIRHFPVSGQVSSLAVAPDGSKLYVGAGSLELLTYNPATGAQLGSSALGGLGSAGGNLVASPGGVWGTTGTGMTQRVWFAPGGDLTQVDVVTGGPGAGLDSVPTYAGGAVWIGGGQQLICANGSTGQSLSSGAIPTDGGVVEYFGDVTVSGGHTYALYQNQGAQQFGVVTLTPPAACSG